MTEATPEAPKFEEPTDRRRALGRRLEAVLEGTMAAELALQFAALSAQFDPEDALAAAGLSIAGVAPASDENLRRLAVIAELADVCETRLSPSQWSMRSAPRARLLDSHRTQLVQIVEWRRSRSPFGDAEKDICDAIEGIGAYSETEVEAEIYDRRSDPVVIERLARAISYAQPVAPATQSLPALRASLAKARAKDDPEAVLLSGGFFGREQEVRSIADSLEEQWSSNPQGPMMVYVGGLGGVGKSTLLADTRQRSRGADVVCVSLDFDRPGIEGGRPLYLTREVARQITEQLGPQSAILYGLIAETSKFLSRGRSDKVEANTLLKGIGDVLRGANRRLLLSLDTIESLTLHGDSAAHELLDWVRELRRVVGQVAVVSAGRENLPFVLAQSAKLIHLDGLVDEAAYKILAERGIEGPRAEFLVEFAKGNPLVLRFGMKLLEGMGGGAMLPSGSLSSEATAEMKAGQLYRLILSRIPSLEVQAIAHPGLLLRRLNAAILRDVIAPIVGLENLDIASSRRLLDELALHAWLVASEGDWLVHRPDVRAVLLDLQIDDRPERAKRLFAKAANWHRDRGDRLDELYYRLQGTRWSAKMPEVEPGLAFQFTAAMIDELPLDARDAVVLARGERSSRFREKRATLRPEETSFRISSVSRAELIAAADTTPLALSGSIMRELRMLLDRRNYAEAAAMIGQVRDFSAIDLSDHMSNTVIEALWRLGDWTLSRRLLRDKLELLAHADTFAVGWEDSALVPAFADTMPQAFRRLVRSDLHFADLAQDLAGRHEDNPEWDVVGLLLAAEGRKSKSTLVNAVWSMWTGSTPSPAEIRNLCEQLSSTLDFMRLGDPIQGLSGLIGALLPDRCHSQILQNRFQTASEKRQKLVASTALATLNAIARDPLATTEMPDAASFAIDRADAEGALPALGAALSLLYPSLRLRRLSQLSTRRAATIAGRWSFGTPPKGWRQPTTDWQTARVLSSYGPAPHDAVAQARHEIELWAAGYVLKPHDQLPPLLDGIRNIVARTSVPLMGDRATALEGIAQQLIDKGVPFTLAAPFAILAHANTPLGARPILPSRPPDPA